MIRLPALDACPIRREGPGRTRPSAAIVPRMKKRLAQINGPTVHAGFVHGCLAAKDAPVAPLCPSNRSWNGGEAGDVVQPKRTDRKDRELGNRRVPVLVRSMVRVHSSSCFDEPGDANDVVARSNTVPVLARSRWVPVLVRSRSAPVRSRRARVHRSSRLRPVQPPRTHTMHTIQHLTTQLFATYLPPKIKLPFRRLFQKNHSPPKGWPVRGKSKICRLHSQGRIGDWS